MVGNIMHAFLQRSIVYSIVLGLLIGVGVTVSPFGAAKAFAEDPADVGTTSESSTQKGNDAPEQSNGSSCVKRLPNAPVVDCGYATFDARLDVPAAATFRRATSGLPGPWTASTGQEFKNGYVGQCQGEFRNVYDPTQDPSTAPNHNMSKAANVSYYSTGVWWQDRKFWSPKVTRENGGFASVPLWKYVSKKVTETRKLPFFPYTPYTFTYYKQVQVKNDPATKTVLITYDNVRGAVYTQQATIQPGESRKIQVVKIDPWFHNRVVNYGGCSFPRTPKLYTNVCAVSVGPGYMQGPYGNAATNPWPVPTGVGKYDPQTEIKRWNTRPANASSNPYWQELGNGQGKMFSPLGLAWKNDFVFQSIAKMGLPVNADGYLPLVENCPDVTFLASAKDQSCIYMGNTFPSDKNKLFPAGSEYCNGFTPGNYRLWATGETITCQIAEVWWDPTPGGGPDSVGQIGRRGSQMTSYNKYPHGRAVYKKSFIGCDPIGPQPDPRAATNKDAHWLCNDATGAIGKNNTYNFSNCSGPRRDGTRDVADEYRCVAANNGNPVIIDPEAGTQAGTISQMLANGKQVQVRWPEPTGISVLSGGVLSRVQQPENMWQNWEVIAGSEPINDSLEISDRNQSIFGHYRQNQDPGSTNSILGGPGKDEWDTPWLYLRAYKSAPVNTTGGNITVGTETIGPDETIPLGVTTTFNATVEKTVSTGFGGTLQINVPVICKMPDAYLYVVSGRAID